MNRSIALLLLLGLLLMVTLSPFAALAGVMLVLLVSGVVWILGALIQPPSQGDQPDRSA